MTTIQKISKLSIFLAILSLTTQKYNPVSVVQIIRPGVSRINLSTMSFNRLEFEGEQDPEEILEPNGARMMYILGSEMKMRYSDIISDPSSMKVKVISSQLEKSVQSAYSYLIGLFPPGTGKKFPEGHPLPMVEPPLPKFSASFTNSSVLPHQMATYPIEIMGTFRDDYFFAHPSRSCPGYYRQVFTRMLHKYADDLNYIEKKLKEIGFSGIYRGGTEDIYQAYNFLESLLYKNGKLPDGVSEESYREIHAYFSYLKSGIDFNNKEEIKIFTTKITEKIIESFEGATSSEQFNPRFTLFSGTGHEIFAFLHGLGITSENCLKEKIQKGDFKTSQEDKKCYKYPAFGASLTFELSFNHEKSSYYVRVLYNGDSVQVCPENKIEDQEYCSMYNFLESVKERLVDYNIITKLCVEYKEIRTELNHTKENVTFFKWASVIGLVILSLIFLCLILECCFRSRDKAMIRKTLQRYKERTQGMNSHPGSSGSLEA